MISTTQLIHRLRGPLAHLWTSVERELEFSLARRFAGDGKVKTTEFDDSLQIFGNNFRDHPDVVAFVEQWLQSQHMCVHSLVAPVDEWCASQNIDNDAHILGIAHATPFCVDIAKVIETYMHWAKVTCGFCIVGLTSPSTHCSAGIDGLRLVDRVYASQTCGEARLQCSDCKISYYHHFSISENWWSYYPDVGGSSRCSSVRQCMDDIRRPTVICPIATCCCCHRKFSCERYTSLSCWVDVRRESEQTCMNKLLTTDNCRFCTHCHPNQIGDRCIHTSKVMTVSPSAFPYFTTVTTTT